MIITIRIMGALAPRRVVRLEFPDRQPPTVREVVRVFLAENPDRQDWYTDGAGGIGRHVHVVLGNDNVRRLGGLDIAADASSEIWLVHAMSGGAR